MKSYIIVSAFGSYVEHFMNELFENNIKIWEIKNKDGIIYFKTSPYFYKIIAETAIASGTKTKVESRHGAYFKLRPYKKRYGVFFGVVSFFGIIVLMSNFIWDIRVSGNQSVSSAQIIEVLEKHGIKSGAGVKSFDRERAELAAILELDMLAWVNIEREGSRVHVKVSERLESDIAEIPGTTPCNVIAAKTGVIVKTEVYRGALLIESGSGVNQGDVIVSGVVEDGAGNIILSHASAKIIAECTDEAEFFAQFTSTERRKNGKITKNNFIVFLGKTHQLFIFGSEPENSTYSEETRIPRFLGFKLPYRLRTGIYTHYDLIEVQIGQTEAMRRLKKEIDMFRQNFYAGSEIISFDEVYDVREDGVGAKVRVVYHTDIAEKKVIGVP